MEIAMLMLAVLAGFGAGVIGGTLALVKALGPRAAARMARGYKVHA